MGEKYEKNTGYADAEGVKFQQNLAVLCCLNGYFHHDDWKVSTENKNAGKFDDVVIELASGVAHMVQTKHRRKEKNVITKKQFLSPKKKSQFGLPKYFFSYENIKAKHGEVTVVICTNASLDTKNLKDVLTEYPTNHNNILHYERPTSSGTFFQFNKNILSELRKCVEDYLQMDGDVDRSITITEKSLEGFLEKLQIFSSFPSGENLENVVTRLLSRLKYPVKVSYYEIHKKVEVWFKQKGEFLTKEHVNVMLCEIISDKYWELLKDYEVSFKGDKLKFSKSCKILHVKTDEGYLLQITKIHDSLKNSGDKALFANSSEDIKAFKQNVDAFELSRYTYLIIVSMGSPEESIVNEITMKLKTILQLFRYKKLIFVAKHDNKLVQRIGMNVLQVDGSIRFEDLSEDTQETILDKDVLFQGNEIKLRKLLCTETHHYTKFLDSQMLTELVTTTNEAKIKIGMQPSNLTNDIAPYYIPRAFQINVHNVDKKREIIPEEQLYTISEKVVIISDSAGMGKSTVLSKIAAHISENYPHLWIIKINLNDYTTILKEKISKPKLNLLELLNSRETTKIINPLEKLIFSMQDKVVLMCDGVDEISPDYTDLIVGLLARCQEASNFSKIFVTTRPHVTMKLESVLKVASFKMLSFSESNQIDFLAGYWSHKLQVNHAQQSKCQQYAKTLIDKMTTWIKSHQYSEINFAAIPMQVNMLAEIFQENVHFRCMDWRGCKEYLEGDMTEPQLPDKFNIAELYEMFIGKKRDAFINKGNSGGNTVAQHALIDQFEGYRVHHRSLALKLLLPEEACLFESCVLKGEETKEYVLDIGIVQRFGDEFKFVHRTFAEYFVAESIIHELKRQEANERFQRVLIDKILVDKSFEIVCVFLDLLLQKNSIPPNTFKAYQSFAHKSNQNFIFHLARQGYTSVLQLILKCLNFTIVRNQEICIGAWRVKLSNKKRNTLNDLEALLRKAGINIKDKKGNTPLHFAVEGGHLEMVRFLVETGATIRCKNHKGSTALHVATQLGMFYIIKYFAEVDPDVNIIKDNMGRTLLHLAAIHNHLEIVKFLVERGADLEDEDGVGCTPLHLAAKWGRLNTVMYLVDKGGSLRTVDHRGRSLVHSAAKWSHLTTLKYLMEHHADVDAKDNKGCAAVHLAAKSGPLDTFTYLLEQEASVNITNREGFTPLHVAAENGRLNIVKLLLKHRADVTIRDNKGRTVLDLAAEMGNLTIVNYFQNIN